MSFILDALKKSESDRQRQTGPSLFEVKVAPPRRTLPVWAIAIAVLLGINIIVVSWMLLRRPAAGNAPAAAAPAPAVSSGAGAAPLATPGGQGSGVDPMSGRSSSESARPPAMAAGTTPAGPAATGAAQNAQSVGDAGSAGGVGVGPGGPAVAAGPRAAGHAASPDQPPSEAAAPADRGQNAEQGAGQSARGNSSDYAPAIQPAGGSEGANGDLPIYQQIAASAGLPDLHLDLHVFADRPQDRFVMINMHRLGEGDSLPNGVQVVAIRTDGVVLTYRGRRFLLPRN